MLGSIEAGGTKFVCAIGNENYQIQDQITIPTTTPQETIKKVIDYFKGYPVDAISIASFGPIEIRKTAHNYGYITTTPKKGWQDTNIVGMLKQEINVPIFFTTDVNGSAYGEYVMTLLANEDINSLLYYTIGTGVGGGAIIAGKLVGSLGHPEMGHVKVKRHPDDLKFKGICPFHADCLEGLVAGPTFEARLGKKGAEVPISHPVWDIMSYYVAQAALQATLLFRPDKIVFGGGVTSEAFLQKVRRDFAQMLNGYLQVPDLNRYITMPEILDNGSATVGNFALAKRILKAID
ncbi:ROK family protein [Lactobacillus sp. ESL0233]|uniref:fructokinase ScrK n=1 Tax=Lactobacillus sp. ESL0233 TaxID=2069354 RepID=UPI000EFC2440|nr:fructokinase ScrK [Lactobacillus sp. ESL0233]RMC40053.1 ROK family protein [Lactobacillus sp. ESL0233]